MFCEICQKQIPKNKYHLHKICDEDCLKLQYIKGMIKCNYCNITIRSKYHHKNHTKNCLQRFRIPWR